MALLGLSILIASFSFLCYRHPPSSWSFPACFQRLAFSNLKSIKPSSSPRVTNTDTILEDHKYEDRSAEITKFEISEDVTPTTNRAELDRKAMPPPPPPSFKSTSKKPITTPSPSRTIPSFNLTDSNNDDEDDEPTAPSFPALNSAQRAHGGTHPTPPLFPAANSAQRASGSSQMRPPPKPPQQAGAGLMPPPRAPIPNRGPPTPSSSSLAPPPTQTSIPTKPRKKVLLTPGHSPLDWARLTSSNANLRGVPPSTPYLRVPPSLLKQYTGRKGKDAWTVLGGKVYNMTPYLPYHPGGEPELMKAAGRDGTRLFGEVHPWVNWESMLEGCMVGIAVEEGDPRRSVLEEMD